jgi:hypothetical protein
MKINKLTICLVGIGTLFIANSQASDFTDDNDQNVFMTPAVPTTRVVTPAPAAPVADDSDVTLPTRQPSAKPSSNSRYIFATEAVYNGNLLGAANAVTSISHDAVSTGEEAGDLLCQAASIRDKAPTGTYKALLNNSNSVNDNFQYINLRNNARVSKSGTSLLAFNTILDAKITRIRSDVTPEVWTGFTPLMNNQYSGWGNSYENGAEKNSCNNWTSASQKEKGVYGDLQYTHADQDVPNSPWYSGHGSQNGSWSAHDTAECDKAKSLICIQQ